MLLFLATLLFLAFLIVERISLNRQINSIPLRICVTGTRGKSSVVRMLASVLRESGKTVLAKTTGAEAGYILANGEEIPIKRRGVVSIIEQKKLIKKAAQQKADVLIAEIMSIHPENHYVESRQIIKPDLIVITNVRLDHIDSMGKTKKEIAAVLCNVITKKSTVFISENEKQTLFQDVVNRMDGKLIVAQTGEMNKFKNRNSGYKSVGFIENTNLVYSVANHLNVPDHVIISGIKNTKFDIGEFKIWTYKSSASPKSVYLVNGFAANDPESTANLISDLKEKLPLQTGKIVGLLNLRPDRADRTLQWIRIFKNRKIKDLQKLFVTGAHSKIIQRKVAGVTILNHKTPEKMMNEIVEKVDDRSAIFGFGNMQGAGKKLVTYWKQAGEEYGV